jgi:CBS domain-containing protein
MRPVLGYGAMATTKEAPMKVSDLQHHQLFTAQADESLDVAADRMNWHQVGALPVLDGQHLAGIIPNVISPPPWPRARTRRPRRCRTT